jgi:hypothetical protein
MRSSPSASVQGADNKSAVRRRAIRFRSAFAITTSNPSLERNAGTVEGSSLYDDDKGGSRLDVSVAAYRQHHA